MKAILTMLFAFVVTCSFGQTQAEMNAQAQADYKKADQALNEVYKKILLKYKTDATSINNLKVSQRIWVSFRDAELDMMYPAKETGYYGSIHPVCRYSYLAKLTIERTNTLEQWLKNPEEGNACAPSAEAQ